MSWLDDARELFWAGVVTFSGGLVMLAGSMGAALGIALVLYLLLSALGILAAML